MEAKAKRVYIFGLIGLLGVLIAIGFYTAGLFFYAPYSGLHISATGEVLEIFDLKQASLLTPGDQVVRINQINPEEYSHSLSLSYWEGVSVGERVPIEIIRNGRPQIVYWTFPGRTTLEFNERLNSQWMLPYLIWTFGFSAFLTVYPKDTIRRLYIILAMLFAIWLAAGSGPSQMHLYYSAYLVHGLPWLIIPVLVHFQWLFPQPFERAPRWIDRAFFPIFYCLSTSIGLLALVYPKQEAYYLIVLIGFLASLLLLFAHYRIQKEGREQVTMIWRLNLIGFLPIIIYIVLELAGVQVNKNIEGGFILGLPLIPGGYLLAIWRGELVSHRFQPNRVLSMYMYAVIILGLAIFLFSISGGTAETFNPYIGIFFMVILALFSAQGYPAFQNLVERYIFRLPTSSARLLQSYSSSLTTTQDTASFSSLFTDLVLPSLQIRQSVLIEFQSNAFVSVLNVNGIDPSQLPSAEQANELIRIMQQNLISPQEARNLSAELRWVRVVLPLQFDKEIIGVWLLGCRDPNDSYDSKTIDILQAIAHQTAIAMVNRQKTRRIRTLYQANIDRDEQERSHLARELHDDTLNELALLQRSSKDPTLWDSLSGVIQSLRKTIQGLRPEMLSYGLLTALQDLGDMLAERQQETKIIVDLSGDMVALPSNTELHLFRIIQQACENALRHADAKTIEIKGNISEKKVSLCVRDDGKGFDASKLLNLEKLIANGNYGLAGMTERADLIHAQLVINTAPGQGTCVQLEWPKPTL